MSSDEEGSEGSGGSGFDFFEQSAIEKSVRPPPHAGLEISQTAWMHSERMKARMSASLGRGMHLQVGLGGHFGALHVVANLLSSARFRPC